MPARRRAAAFLAGPGGRPPGPCRARPSPREPGHAPRRTDPGAAPITLGNLSLYILNSDGTPLAGLAGRGPHRSVGPRREGGIAAPRAPSHLARVPGGGPDMIPRRRDPAGYIC